MRAPQSSASVFWRSSRRINGWAASQPPRLVAYVHPGQGSEPVLLRRSGILITWTLADSIFGFVCHPDQKRMASIPAVS